MRKKYQVFTPYETAIEMINSVSYCGKKILDSKVLDLSCGDGIFLCCALELFLKESKKEGYDNRTIVNKANSLFYGFEIDEEVHNQCINNMNKVLFKCLGERTEWANIRCADGLKANTKNFDYVFGNPPYISYQEMNQPTRDFLKDTFKTCKGDKYDYSYAFIEKSILSLNSNGKAIIIAPINMYKMKSAKYYRVFVSDYIVFLKDVSYENIFKGVITNPAISLFNKSKTDDYFVYRDNKIEMKVSKNELLNRLLFRKNKNRGLRFGDYFKVSCGVATLLNEAFILDDNEKDKVEIELLKNAVSPKFDYFKSKKYIIFPYHFIGQTLVKYSEDEFKSIFPKATKHLERYKDRLLKRDCDASAKWFEYGRSQAISFQKQEKILISAIITKHFLCRKIDVYDIPVAGYYIIPLKPDLYTLDDAMTILNDKKTISYLESVGIKMSGDSFRYSPKDLEDYIF